MKRWASILFLLSLCVCAASPAYARPNSQAHTQQKALKKQQKAMKKYQKAQKKAQKKMQKYDRKHTHYPKHSY